MLPPLTTIPGTLTHRIADRVKHKWDTGELNRVWICDITYLRTGEGWLYLCVVRDACSRRVLGWAIDSHQDADLVERALRTAKILRGQLPGKVVFHGDRGHLQPSPTPLLDRLQVPGQLRTPHDRILNLEASRVIGTCPQSADKSMYGITETTVHVTWFDVTPDRTRGGASIVGRPLPTLKTNLVDRGLNVVPFGVPGEILVSGAGVSLGYHGNPHLTAERFIELPGETGRWHRSGDLALVRADGMIEYLCRIDSQVLVPALALNMTVTALACDAFAAGKPELAWQYFRRGAMMCSAITVLLVVADEDDARRPVPIASSRDGA